jgi:hypothetical protein
MPPGDKLNGSDIGFHGWFSLRSLKKPKSVVEPAPDRQAGVAPKERIETTESRRKKAIHNSINDLVYTFQHPAER